MVSVNQLQERVGAGSMAAVASKFIGSMNTPAGS